MQAAPGACTDPLPEGEGGIDDNHQLGGEHAEPGPERPVGGDPGDKEVRKRDRHGVVEQEREPVQRECAEAEQGEEAMEVGDDGRLQRCPEGPRFEHQSAEDGGGQQGVGEEAARSGEDPEGGVALHPSPPASSVRPSRVTRTVGIASLFACSSAEEAPARKSVLASTSASTALAAATVTRRRSLLRRGGRWSGRSGGAALGRRASSGGGRARRWRARPRRARA